MMLRGTSANRKSGMMEDKGENGENRKLDDINGLHRHPGPVNERPRRGERDESAPHIGYVVISGAGASDDRDNFRRRLVLRLRDGVLNVQLFRFRNHDSRSLPIA